MIFFIYNPVYFKNLTDLNIKRYRYSLFFEYTHEFELNSRTQNSHH